MEFMFLNFILFVLAIGFTAGYWLLVTADKQDRKWMHYLGSVFGWVLILLAFFTSFSAAFFKSKYDGEMFFRRPCPMMKMMHNHDRMNQMPSNKQMNQSDMKDTDDFDKQNDVNDEDGVERLDNNKD